MADKRASAKASAKDEAYKPSIGEIVWAKVKGYNYWPGEVIPGDAFPQGKKKNLPDQHCVRFFDSSSSHGWVSEDAIRAYEAYREKFSKLYKSAKFAKGIKEADAKYAQLNNKTLEPLNISVGGNSSGAAGTLGLSTPKGSAPSTPASPAVFSASKAANATKKVNSNSTTPIQRDYSRQPFKPGARRPPPSSDAFDAVFGTPLHYGKRDASPVKPILSAGEGTPDKKRVKIVEPPPSAKKTPITSKLELSPLKPKLNDGFKDDYSSSAPFSPSSPTTAIITKSPRAAKSSPAAAAAGSAASSRPPSNLKFGFIGLGNMGQQVLRNLLQVGHEIAIWNRTPIKCKEFEKQGATVMKTPGDVIRESDITFSCLSDAEASSKIFFGNCGVSHEINASKGYVELTSMDPTTSMDIEETIKKKGGRYLEAPLISSIPKQVDEGQLVAMAAGDRSLFDDCSSCFETICSHVYFLSEEAGTAAKMNLVIATLHGNILGSLLESTALAERLGLLPKDFVEILTNSPFSSALVESKSKAIAESTLMKDIPFSHILRDLKYTLEMSNKHNYSTPITAITNEVFKQKQHHYF